MAVANFSYSHIWALSVSKEAEVHVLLVQGQILDMEVQEYAFGINSVYCIITYCYLLCVVTYLNHHWGEQRTRDNVHVYTSVHPHWGA